MIFGLFVGDLNEKPLLFEIIDFLFKKFNLNHMIALGNTTSIDAEKTYEVIELVRYLIRKYEEKKPFEPSVTKDLRIYPAPAFDNMINILRLSILSEYIRNIMCSTASIIRRKCVIFYRKIKFWIFFISNLLFIRTESFGLA